jgi:hypothetical protein
MMRRMLNDNLFLRYIFNDNDLVHIIIIICLEFNLGRFTFEKAQTTFRSYCG